ncbi:peptidoglycan recognition protein 1-like [Macrosteles quadrilineatus]|uniref:peptidoglycan recognition protein 1-like n=1 Tax=Macrosteles quadrilineatus TaxID=74068 RepID=UPI0023E26400|nr:peptidoglycan recognition protein 1-like [Macrosteles quadrilineatus]
MAMTITMVTRDEWGARQPKQTLPLTLPVQHVICSLTRTQPCFSLQSCKHFVKRFQKYHQAVKKRLDIPYNFLLAPDGTVFEGRGWHNYTEFKYWLPKGHTIKDAVHIALIGDYKDQNIPIPRPMLEAMKYLILFGIKKHFIDENYELHMV